MNAEEKKQIMDGLVYEQVPNKQPGGQQAGVTIYGCRLRHPEFNFEVYCREFRSATMNRQFCTTIFELFLSEVSR